MIMRLSVEGPEVFEELKRLLDAHAEEINHGPKPRPNWEAYERLLNSDFYILFTARVDGELIGYAGFFINESMHYMGYNVANCDLIYVKPEYRGQGHRLIEYAEYNLRAAGIHEIMHSVTNEFDYSKTLMRQGYVETERLFAKKLID